jgi:hypothetical protein
MRLAAYSASTLESLQSPKRDSCRYIAIPLTIESGGKGAYDYDRPEGSTRCNQKGEQQSSSFIIKLRGKTVEDPVLGSRKQA